MVEILTAIAALFVGSGLNFALLWLASHNVGYWALRVLYILAFILHIFFFLVLITVCLLLLNYLVAVLFEIAKSESFSPVGLLEVAVLFAALGFSTFLWHSLFFSFPALVRFVVRVVRLDIDKFPKLLDFPYYALGSLAFLSVLMELQAGRFLSESVIRFQVYVGVIAVSLKLVKATMEIYMGLYRADNISVRTVWGKSIIPPDVAMPVPPNNDLLTRFGKFPKRSDRHGGGGN